MKKKVFQFGIGQRRHSAGALSMLAVIIMCCCMAAWAHAGSEPIATVEVYAAAIVFVPTGGAENHLLTVKGNDGFYFQEEFGAEENPWIPLDTEGGFLPDGRYRYELRTQPVIDAAALEEAESTGDDRLREAIAREERKLVKRQSGTFEIVDGTIVLPGQDGEEGQE